VSAKTAPASASLVPAQKAPESKPCQAPSACSNIIICVLKNSRSFLRLLGTAFFEEALLPRIGTYRTPIDDATLGQRLRSLRKKRGLSQAEVAEALAVHQSLVSEYERGTVRVPATVLAGLARTLRAPFHELIGWKATEENGSIQDRRFIRRLERIDKLPKRAKQALLKTIDTYLAGAEKR
jgi:transcriptional regulator with XRE-family HTH domain